MNGWRLRLSARSAALLGGITHAPVGAHAATASLDSTSGRPLLLFPGTSLRGVLRDAFRRFVAARGHECLGGEDCPCPTCDLFGCADRSGALWFRSALVEGKRHVAAGVAIDRSRRTVARAERALWVEERGVTDFDVQITASRVLTEAENALLDDFWAWIEVVGLSVGRRKSAGVGRFDVKVLPLEADRTVVPAPSQQDDDPVTRYLVRLTLLEPARLVGHRQRDFYRDGLETIPVPTLRGALGWALERRGAGSVAEDLFLERPIRLTPGFPVGSNGPTSIPPWLSRWCCDGNPRHIVDGALHRVAHVLTDAGSWRLDACPQCSSSLRELESGAPPPLILGHVTIDPTQRRAMRGELHYQVTLAPGTVFAAELLAYPSQAEALRRLETVFVGGRRARGMGLAQIELKELSPLPPVKDRIAATAGCLADLGAPDEDGVAVLGLITDAALERPLRELLADADLEVLTGEARSVVRGGWDEKSGRMRPLRRLLEAGSWLAVRTRSDRALAELERLEREGIHDPEGVAPLLLRVRDDWEVVEMTAETSPSAAGTDIDELVREARALCRKHAQTLPARAGLQTLLRFAQGTDSVEEMVLFIEYQATRDQLKKAKDFLREVAQFVASRFAGDPEGARRFLGFIVRAGHVEAKRRNDSQSSGGRRGQR